ncbi:hypothetical protein ACW7G2_13295 [Luteimonas sp. A277]
MKRILRLERHLPKFVEGELARAAISRMTKGEVINGGLAVARLIHDRSWYERLDEELRNVLPLQAA